MAAARLGFPDIYSALNDKSTEALSSGLLDGTAWVIRPFLTYILPLALAKQNEQQFDVIRLLRNQCPLLQATDHPDNDIAQLLLSLRGHVDHLQEMLSQDDGSRVGDVMRYMTEHGLIFIDERWADLLGQFEATADPVDDPAPDNAALRFMQCDASQLWGYRQYIKNLSPFSTQQGIKGAEFEKVMVVIDDEESRTNTFSYGKYFGIIDLSGTDRENLDSGRDSVVDRTRRLFYVCCSRALSDLAVVVFAGDTARMREALISRGFFETECIHVFD